MCNFIHYSPWFSELFVIEIYCKYNLFKATNTKYSVLFLAVNGKTEQFTLPCIFIYALLYVLELLTKITPKYNNCNCIV